MNFVLGFHSWVCFGSLPLFSLSCCFCSFPFRSKLYELAYILFERRLNIFQTLTYKLNTMPNTVLPESGVHGHKTGSKLTGRKKEGERWGFLIWGPLPHEQALAVNEPPAVTSLPHPKPPPTLDHFVFIVSPWTPCPFLWILLAWLCPSCQSLEPKSGQWPCGHQSNKSRRAAAHVPTVSILLDTSCSAKFVLSIDLTA